MGKVIDFRECRSNIEAKRINLSTFNIPINYVDAKVLYSGLSSERQSEDFLFYEKKEDMFYDLKNVLTNFNKKRAAWIVLDKDKGYLYIKEKGTIYMAEKGALKRELKNAIDEFAIDYMMCIERVSHGKYRKIVGW